MGRFDRPCVAMKPNPMDVLIPKVDRYFYVLEEEAQEVFGNEYTDFELEGGKYIVG